MMDVLGTGEQTDVTAGRVSSQFLREYRRRGYLVYLVQVFPFSLASVLVFLFLGSVIISCSISSRSTSCSAIIMIILL